MIAKRIIDILGSIAMIIIFSPVMIASVIAIKVKLRMDPRFFTEIYNIF